MPARKVIALPPDLVEEVAPALRPSSRLLLGKRARRQVLRAYEQWKARPRPVTLLGFFEQQGAALHRELAGGVSHATLYRRFTAAPDSPIQCGYGRFNTVLTKFRQLQNLPPQRRKSHSENVTDPPPLP